MTQHAGVVELADTWDLKSHIREDVRVRAPSPAPAASRIQRGAVFTLWPHFGKTSMMA